MRKVCFLMAMLLFCASAYAVPEGYTPAGNGKNCYFYGENGYIVEYRYNYEERRKAIMQEYIDNYNYRLTGDQYNVYFYFINNSRSIDFTQDLSGENDIYLDLMSRLSFVDGSSALQIQSMEEYERYFYQTDHHWNHVGTHQGYEDILKLLNVEEAPLQPVEEVVFDAVYNGSYASRTGIRNATQNFAVYRYDMPEKAVTVKGRPKKIGRPDAYFDGKYSREALAPHYVTFYGGDFGEILYDTNRPERENLLILCNSYGCSVRELVSNHFNKTFVVDMREYAKLTGLYMNLRDYIEKNDIDKVLIVGDVSYFLYGGMI